MLAVGPARGCAPLTAPLPSRCSWTCPSCSPSLSLSSSPRTMSPSCWEHCCGMGWGVGGAGPCLVTTLSLHCPYLVLALSPRRLWHPGTTLVVFHSAHHVCWGGVASYQSQMGLRCVSRGDLGQIQPSPRAGALPWVPIGLSRNYPDWMFLIMAPASIQPLWVHVLTASSSVTLLILLTCGTLGLLPWCCTWGN